MVARYITRSAEEIQTSQTAIGRGTYIVGGLNHPVWSLSIFC
jgi:hypothetical protein